MGRKIKDTSVNYVRCPICDSYDNVGHQGYGRFFCRDCYVEFKLYSVVDKKRKVKMHKIDTFDIDANGISVKLSTVVIGESPIEEEE